MMLHIVINNVIYNQWIGKIMKIVTSSAVAAETGNQIWHVPWHLDGDLIFSNLVEDPHPSEIQILNRVEAIEQWLFDVAPRLSSKIIVDYTFCPGSSDPFYIVTYYIKWVTTDPRHTVVHYLLRYRGLIC